ncbi:hypothetical protein [Streptomyces sp. DH8]|uniref:hypothetical protein n=1 Tax=Streptomyces sp. DH8 TaxID=2857008 RepID=UPI001E425B47|nr:hypothetical protein [Streptomyces sp. DH8]
MNRYQDWSLIPSPARIVSGVAFTSALYAAVDLAPGYAPGPEAVAYDDGGGSTLALGLDGAGPVLVVDDHDERDAPMSREQVVSALGLTGLPGHLSPADDRTFCGAARWDGRSWSPAFGVPGQVVGNLVDELHLLGEADQILADVTGGEAERPALAALLGAVRTGAWSRDTLAAALRLTPYEEDEELEAEPDVDAATEALEVYRPLLLRLL